MKEIVVYEAKDGKRFDKESDCYDYEIVIYCAEQIMETLKPRTPIDYNHAVQQDLQEVRSAFNKFMLLCARVIPLFARHFEEVADGTRHPSHAWRILSDYSYDYPVLHKVWSRFECISQTSGIEYEQPYYTQHENEFKGEIIK